MRVCDACGQAGQPCADCGNYCLCQSCAWPWDELWYCLHCYLRRQEGYENEWMTWLAVELVLLTGLLVLPHPLIALLVMLLPTLLVLRWIFERPGWS